MKLSCEEIEAVESEGTLFSYKDEEEWYIGRTFKVSFQVVRRNIQCPDQHPSADDLGTGIQRGNHPRNEWLGCDSSHRILGQATSSPHDDCLRRSK